MVGTTTGTYLNRILENTATELQQRKALIPLANVWAAADAASTPLSFTATLRQTGVAIIAEVKRASPSKGEIAPNIIAADVAREYIAGGASAISVLTDRTFFQGTIEDLKAVAALGRASATPVLRKDFMIDAYQIAEAKAAGAAAVLLIVAALERSLLAELHDAARGYGLDALVEVHDEAELEIALGIGASLIGVNNRDLRSFNVDLATSERLAAEVPDGITLVGESGIRTRDDVERLRQAGVHAVLVGETLMRAPDRAAAVRELLG
ncbi:MAG TPA: indole-3-glycerol phosphate synthase TrpC [Thermomicrobiales bacterium]|nr:indole-3-glycerol phosphate synthase TrpC [Thermomicrobiales bacterium]